jgi:SAM-dependent methyltransferase
MAQLAQRAQTEEQMDAADLDPLTYAQVLADLGRVNRWTLATRPTLGFLANVARQNPDRPIRVLDVGFGDGGMLRAIAIWAGRRSVLVDLHGIDLNPRSEAVARAATDPSLAITYRTGDYQALAGEGWDVILSSLVTHHMSDDERQDFLRFMEGETALGWFVNDLHRHGFAHAGYPLLAWLLRVHPIVRADGQLSIARSFRPDDWQAMLAQAGIGALAQVRRVFPFRLCVARLK